MRTNCVGPTPLVFVWTSTKPSLNLTELLLCRSPQQWSEGDLMSVVNSLLPPFSSSALNPPHSFGSLLSATMMQRSSRQVVWRTERCAEQNSRDQNVPKDTPENLLANISSNWPEDRSDVNTIQNACKTCCQKLCFTIHAKQCANNMSCDDRMIDSMSRRLVRLYVG